MLISFTLTTLIVFILVMLTIGAFFGWKMRKWFEEFKRN